LAQCVAARLGVPFAYTQPRVSHSTGLYRTRYDVPAGLTSRLRGRKVAIIDDVINAGSAVRATVDAVRACGGYPSGVAALLQLGRSADGPVLELGLSIQAVTRRANTVYDPAVCPMCSAYQPLDSAT